MRYDSYKLIEILPQEIPEKFVVQSHHSEYKYPYLYSKVRVKNSRILESYKVNQRLKFQGTFVDINVLSF